MKMAHCVGCDDYFPAEQICTYRVTFSSGEREDADYCGECAHLASINWTGDTISIKRLHKNLPREEVDVHRSR